jgi:hypothetical protein
MRHSIRFRYHALCLGIVIAAGAGAAAGSVSGCAAAPRERPIELGPVDQGPGSLAYVRRQLEGSWDLVALEVRNASGAMTPAKAKAVLTYDAYGNMQVRGKLNEALPDAATPLAASAIDYSGQIVIDPRKNEFRMTEQDAAAPLDPGVKSVLRLSRVRRYELTADTLKIHVMDEGNAVVATTTFRKVS